MNSTQDTSFFGHPRGLATLFFTEMWERFSYYGGRALLILYMTDQLVNGGLGFTVADAGAIYGLYTASVYLTNLPGGWISDKFLGARNAVFYGGIIIALGNVLLAFPGIGFFYGGLALIAVGTGLLKPNVSTMVGSLYDKTDNRRDAGFSIFYMGINLGAFLAPLIAGYIGETINWRYGFLAVAVGMCIGLVQYKMGDKHLGTVGHFIPPSTAEEAAKQRKSLFVAMLFLAASFAIPYILHLTGSIQITIDWIKTAMTYVFIAIPIVYFGFLFLRGGFTTDEKKRLAAIFVFFVAAALFWGSFEQAGSTLTLFADRHTNNQIFGLTFPTTWWQSVNSIWIISLAPVFAALWLFLNKKNLEPSTPVKFGLGLLFVGLSFLLLVVPANAIVSAPDVKVGVIWLLTVYFLQTVGELCLSPVGLSTMTKLAPERVVGQMMGVWFLGAAVGNFIGGNVGGLFETYPLNSLFLAVAGTSIAVAVVMFALVPWVKKLMGDIK
ncbi:MAG TPA: peptide MFS transporter [Rhodothermales bacterium]|nr:peptide MFS transporter [Rhodothermales bacterium]HRR08546.1 peptide MFS transporter [Rhodothermales bacterium]